jgi:hypothetical protein
VNPGETKEKATSGPFVFTAGFVFLIGALAKADQTGLGFVMVLVLALSGGLLIGTGLLIHIGKKTD